MKFRMKFSIQIPIKSFEEMFDLFGNDGYVEIDKWCKENCEGGWGWKVGTTWSFQNEKDALAFKLRWI